MGRSFRCQGQFRGPMFPEGETGECRLVRACGCGEEAERCCLRGMVRWGGRAVGGGKRGGSTDYADIGILEENGVVSLFRRRG